MRRYNDATEYNKVYMNFYPKEFFHIQESGTAILPEHIFRLLYRHLQFLFKVGHN